jgi:IS1 family transposase
LYAKVRDSEQARWLWLAIDPVTKVIPSLHLGGRKNEDAYAVAHDLKERLDPACVPSFTTDGLWGYFYALTAHFGHWFRPNRARTHRPGDDRRRHSPHAADTYCGVVWVARSTKSGQIRKD